MSFSAKMKDDLARIISSKSCCRKAEFLAFFLINGNIKIGNGVSLVMQTENSAVARKMFTLAKDFSLKREVSVFRRARLNKNQVYILLIPPQDQMDTFFNSLGMIDEQQLWHLDFCDQVWDKFLSSSCCKRAYLRGSFLAAGSITNPESGSYHLAIEALDKAQAELLLKILASFNLSGKIIQRKDTKTVYIKDAEQISDFMNIIGSHRALLEFEAVRVTKEMRNQINRRRNCDTANINKTVEAALRQKMDIEYILEKIGIESLPKTLRQAAELRLDNPESSLSELAELSNLGRSALNYRLRRLGKIAENIRDYGPESWDIL